MYWNLGIVALFKHVKMQQKASFIKIRVFWLELASPIVSEIASKIIVQFIARGSTLSTTLIYEYLINAVYWCTHTVCMSNAFLAFNILVHVLVRKSKN